MQNKGPTHLTGDEINLPSTVFDECMSLGPWFLYNLLSKVLGFNLKFVSLPEGLTGKNKIPSYALQEFHNLPNGYYSLRFTKGYSTAFNYFMLGEMGRIRRNIARELRGCRSVLDLGCGDGCSTKALCEADIRDVWGLDPSPYMLAHAIEKTKSAKFVQGVGEDTGFDDESFDGISACWVFHEIPSRVCDMILDECFRILKPGGKLVLAEPSKHQFGKPSFQLLKDFGMKGPYFRFLASHIHEPYINEWHNKEIKPWIESHGFQLISNVNGMPEEVVLAMKPATVK